MENKQLIEFKKWFEEYFNRFSSQDSDVNKIMNLKRDHTYRVCEEIVALGRQLHLKTPELLLAETMALFHDVGRFEQYQTYKTFLDLKSINHAELAVRILNENQVLKKLTTEEQQIITTAIRLHNRKMLPTAEAETRLFFARLLRDADKLDIWRVVIDYYYRITSETNGAIELGLPETAEISAGAIENLLHEKIVEVEHIKNINDFKLLQIGWIYDVNFMPTLRAVHDRKYLEKILDKLPPVEEIQKVRHAVLNFVERKIAKKT